ncbi:hypothetical protein HanRHA438_Chr05g0222431 [Helianthus annuus]|nr:hypothetical protein HanRHA438_Chr05g0222431 [Helianthus annuus]
MIVPLFTSALLWILEKNEVLAQIFGNQRLQSGVAGSKTYPPPFLPRHRHQNMRVFFHHHRLHLKRITTYIVHCSKKYQQSTSKPRQHPQIQTSKITQQKTQQNIIVLHTFKNT